MTRRKLAAFVAATTGALSWGAGAWGQVFTWINPFGGTFSSPGNWFPAGPPTLGTHTALFSTPAAYPVTLTAAAVHGPLIVTAGDVSFQGFHPYNVASVTISGSAANLGNGVTVTAGGVTSIQPGGALNINLGGAFNANQNVTVAGGTLARNAPTGFNLLPGRTLTVQADGTASFSGNWRLNGNLVSVTDGRVVASGYLDLAGPNGNGTLVVNGSNARVQTGADTALWGVSGFVGEGAVFNGGVGTLGGLRLGADATAGSSGRLVVDAGAVFTQAVDVGFSPSATGLVTISNGGQMSLLGGSLTVGAAGVGAPNGTINLGSGTLTGAPAEPITINARGVVSVGPGGVLRPQGDFLISGGSLLVNAGTLHLPAGRLTRVESGGTLTLTAGASLDVNSGHTLLAVDSRVAAGSVHVGDAGAGTIAISGAAARFTAAQLLRIGTPGGGIGTVGFAGGALGTFTSGVEVNHGHFSLGGGVVTVQGSPLRVGATGGSGSLLLSGGSIIANTGLHVRPNGVANLQSGNLFVNNGSLQVEAGTLTVGAANLVLPNNAVTVLSNGGRFTVLDQSPVPTGGTLRVLSGSRFEGLGLAAALNIGVSGNGTLEVSGIGSQATLPPLGVGSTWGGNPGGQATVSFAGGGVGTLGSVSAGVGGGQATLSIAKGSSVSMFTLGAGTGGGTASIAVGGAGASLAAQLATLGGGASLGVSNGGVLAFGQTQLSGRIAVAGGTASLGALTLTGGTISLVNGAVTFDGPLSSGSNGVLGPSPGIGPAMYVGAGGNVVLEPFSTLSLNGGELRAASIVQDGGTLLWSSGTLHLTAGGAVAITGPLGPSLNLPAGKHLRLSQPLVVADTGIVTQSGGGLTLESGAQINGVYQFDGGFVASTGGWTIHAPGALVVAAHRAFNLASQVDNAGQIELGGGAARIAGQGTLTNAPGGLIGGDGVIAKPLVNAGEVRAGLGQTLRLAGGVTGQSGRIHLLGGAVDIAGPLDNAGSITGRGALTSGGITNAGVIQLSAGLSDLSGTLTNAAGGRTIISGGAVASFYSPVHNAPASEFRVSTGATAVFFDVVSGLGQFTGSGTVVFESGTSPGPLVTAGRGVVGPAGVLRASVIRQSALFVEGDTRLTTGDGTTISRLVELDLAGTTGQWLGLLDLADDALIIDYAGDTPRTRVLDQIRQGFAGGTWSGRGITSSVAAAAAGQAVGVAEASALGVVSFLGDPVDASALLLRHTLAGDATLDGAVNIADFARLAAAFNGPGYWVHGDFNYDGVAGIGDFAVLAANFNRSLPSAPARAPVPEPGLIAWLAVAAMATRHRRASGFRSHPVA